MNNIVLDVDGVILDFSTNFINWFNDKFKKEINDNKYPKLSFDPHKYNFDYDETYPADFFDQIQEYVDMQPELPLIDKLFPLLTNLLHEKYNVHIISAYPHLDSRIANLNKFGIKYKTITCNIHDKLPLIKKLQPLFVIEDHPEMIKQLSSENIKCYAPLLNYTTNLSKLPHVQIYTNVSQLIDVFFTESLI